MFTPYFFAPYFFASYYFAEAGGVAALHNKYYLRTTPTMRVFGWQVGE